MTIACFDLRIRAMVNVWVDELSLSFGQYQVDAKSNEIIAIPKLLDVVDCQGSV